MEIADLQDFDGEIYYGFNDDADSLMLLGKILHPMTKDNWGSNDRADCYNIRYNNDKIKIVKMSKQTIKHFKNNEQFKHVSDFFQKVEDLDEQ